MTEKFISSEKDIRIDLTRIWKETTKGYVSGVFSQHYLD